MKNFCSLLLLVILFDSCSLFTSLNSNTSIKPKERFVLGKNKHGAFKTRLTNEGVTTLKIYQEPIEGGSYSPILIEPKKSIKLKTKRDTSLIIENTGEVYASVTLKVTGDLNLGMSYNQ